MSRQIHVSPEDGQRTRRAQFRAAGRCPTCGRVRDRMPFLNCRACVQSIAKSKAKQTYVEPVEAPTAHPQPVVVHPRWPVPLPGTVALSMVYGVQWKKTA